MPKDVITIKEAIRDGLQKIDVAVKYIDSVSRWSKESDKTFLKTRAEQARLAIQALEHNPNPTDLTIAEIKKQVESVTRHADDIIHRDTNEYAITDDSGITLGQYDDAHREIKTLTDANTILQQIRTTNETFIRNAHANLYQDQKHADVQQQINDINDELKQLNQIFPNNTIPISAQARSIQQDSKHMISDIDTIYKGLHVPNRVNDHKRQLELIKIEINNMNNVPGLPANMMFSSQLQKLRNANETLTKAKKQAEDDLYNYKKNYNKRVASTQIANLEAENKTLTTNLANTKSALETETKELAKANQDLADAKNDLTKANQNLESTRKLNGGLIQQIRKLQQEIDDTKATLDTVEKNINTLQQTIEQKDKQIKDLNATIAAKDQEINSNNNIAAQQLQKHIEVQKKLAARLNDLGANRQQIIEEYKKLHEVVSDVNDVFDQFSHEVTKSNVDNVVLNATTLHNLYNMYEQNKFDAKMDPALINGPDDDSNIVTGGNDISYNNTNNVGLCAALAPFIVGLMTVSKYLIMGVIMFIIILLIVYLLHNMYRMLKSDNYYDIEYEDASNIDIQCQAYPMSSGSDQVMMSSR